MAAGTLIGVVITAGGIVIGSDGAISENGKRLRDDVVKVCQLGPNTVASIQGQYGLTHKPSGSSVQLHALFHQTCSELRKISGVLSPDQYAQRLIASLHLALTKYLQAVPPSEFSPPFAPDTHIVYVSVAGFAGSKPAVVVKNIRVRRSGRGRWSAYIRDAPKLGLSGCGVTFHGDDVVAWGLMRDASSLPSDVRKEPVLVAARALGSANCQVMSLEHARALFVFMVRATVKYGTSHKIPTGSVGGDLTVFTIPAGGLLRAETIRKY